MTFDLEALTPRLLLGPGPSPVSDRVRAAMSAPTVGHLDPQFLEIIDNVISGAMPLSGDKLDADEIRTIELWRAGGFLE